MIIVDEALRARAAADRPVRVAMIGAGFMGHGIANQIINSTPGMELVAIANRTPSRALDAYEEAGVPQAKVVEGSRAVQAALATGGPVVCEDPLLLTTCEDGVDAIIEVTGTIGYAAEIVLSAIDHAKPVILMNAELDGTLGAILQERARRAGVIVTGCDGDQPGVQMNLYRFVAGMGLDPLVCGNIKGLQDPYRNPTTQRAFAERWGQNPQMVTSFADGTKISFEQAIVANATGMTVAQRGMIGREFDGHVDELTSCYNVDELREWGGIVDYVVGSRPSPGVFVLAAHEDPKQRHYLNLYKLGEGPLYSFYTPYHLCHFEVPLSVARVVLFGDTVLAPAGAPKVEVVATAKTDLPAGATLDGLGCYMTYGQCERAEIVRDQDLLPIGLAEGCRLSRPVAKDEVLRYDDVLVPEGRLEDALRAEQDRLFA